jgi:hypothetical protein
VAISLNNIFVFRRILTIGNILWLGTTIGAQGIDLRRACISSNNDISLVWFSSSCLSDSVQIFAQSDTTQTFELLSSSVHKNTFLHVNALSKGNKWRYFIVGKDTCSILIVLSDTLKTDIIQPNLVSLDSISIAMNNQDVHVSWFKEQSPDLLGYIVWQNIGANNQPIDTIVGEYYYHFRSSLINSTVNYRISALDSCYNQSVISDFHRSVYLSAAIDSCASRLNLLWNLYTGRIVDSTSVFIKRSVDPDFNKVASLNGNIFNYSLISSPNETVEVYVQSHGKLFSSRSNTLSVSVPQLLEPNENNIVNVSVNATNEIVIVPNVSANASLFPKYFLLSIDSNDIIDTIYTSLTQDVVSQPELIFPELKTSIVYSFEQLLKDQCNREFKTTLSNNIVLSLRAYQENEFLLQWNNYNYWENGVKEYQIYKGNLNVPRETWLNILTSIDDTSILQNTITDIVDENNCYYVKGIQNLDLTEAYSNTVCFKEKNQVFFPNSINPNNPDNHFIIKGTNLDLGNSQLDIFARNGQRVYSNNIKQNFKGTSNQGEVLPTGLYNYVAKIYFTDGEWQTFSNTIFIIY